MSSKNKSKDFFKKIVVVISAALLTIILTQDYLFTIAPLKQLELKLIDSRFLKRGSIEIKDSAKVIILEITQDSYDQIPSPYNKWPWPRFIFAKLLNNLTQAGVKAIGIDIEMSLADQNSPNNDSLMMKAIKNSRRVVVAGKIDDVREKMIEDSKSWVKKENENYGNIFFIADSSVGIVQPPPDYDGVFRRYWPFRYTEITKSRVPSFGFALINKYYGYKSTETAKRKDGYFNLVEKKIPQYDPTSVLINFYGSSGTFPHVKLIDVLDDKYFKTKDEIDTGADINTWDDPDYGILHTGVFKDKVVIIGSTMPEDRDLFPISFAKGTYTGDNVIYGVEFHANIVQNILSNNFLYNQSKESELLTVLILTAFTFFITSFIRKLKIRKNLIAELLNVIFMLLMIFGIYEISTILFIINKLVTAIVSPALAVVIGYFASTAYHFIQERQANVMIKGMFSQYVNMSVVNELLSNPDKLRLGGERKNVSILFSDIAGFTSFAENKQPEELVSFINEYLNEMTDIVLINNGTLDKYLGDAVMAFWGAPIEFTDHAYKACISALQMQAKLSLLREKWMKSGEASIRIRIGINTGDVIVGNIGGEKRFDYTVLGDDVNLASRLEGANKEYGTNIMISQATLDCCSDKILARELDVIRVKGKAKPTKVYELISEIGDKIAEEAIDKMDFYFQGLELYRHKSFDVALDYFKRSYEKLSDHPSKVYINRCEFYISNPPEDSWDGVFELKSK